MYCGGSLLKVFILVCLILTVGKTEIYAQAGKPNILIFITDDESWLELGAYGKSKIPTPNFDKVAKNGILFTNAYASAPSCAPSRASLLTGRNFWELKQGAFIQAWLPKEFPLITDILKKQNYHVGLTGKGWGPGIYPEQGHAASLGGVIKNEIKLPAAERVEFMSPINYTANFGEFLQSKKTGQPFFFWYGSNEPHDPYAEDNWQRLEKEFGVTLNDMLMPGFIENTPANKKKRANMAYEACIADRQLGTAIKLLEEKGELDNTIIIFTSDNGTYVGEKSKASAYDLGSHVPLAIMWPGKIKAGRTVTDFINFSDLAPTLLEIAGIKNAYGMTGKGFLDVLLSTASGRVDSGRNYTVTGLEWHGEMDPESKSFRTITTDQFTYIIKYSNQRAVEIYTSPESEIIAEEFYDIQKDPWQSKNLVQDLGYKAVITELKKRLTDYAIKTGDPRFTGDMSTFRLTRQFVQERKRNGYKNKTE